MSQSKSVQSLLMAIYYYANELQKRSATNCICSFNISLQLRDLQPVCLTTIGQKDVARKHCEVQNTIGRHLAK